MMSETLKDQPRYVARPCRLYGQDTAAEVFDRGRNEQFCQVDPIGTGGDGQRALARAEEIAAKFNGPQVA